MKITATIPYRKGNVTIEVSGAPGASHLRLAEELRQTIDRLQEEKADESDVQF